MSGAIVLVIGVGTVIAFVAASVWNARNYAESLRPADDLRRVGDGPNPAGGDSNGGPIPHDNH